MTLQEIAWLNWRDASQGLIVVSVPRWVTQQVVITALTVGTIVSACQSPWTVLFCSRGAGKDLSSLFSIASDLPEDEVGQEQHITGSLLPRVTITTSGSFHPAGFLLVYPILSVCRSLQLFGTISRLTTQHAFSITPMSCLTDVTEI